MTKKRAIILVISVIIIALILTKQYIKMLEKTKLSENFLLGEFMHSDIAIVLGIPNIPSRNEIANTKALVTEILQPLRDYFKVPMDITSGGRSEELNPHIPGSSATSQHKKWEAADIKMVGISNEDIVHAAKELKLPYDQLINEKLYYKDGQIRTWVHVSHRRDGRNRGQVLLARNTPSDLSTEYYPA